MKDFVVTPRQLDAAHACGASAVLLIDALLDGAHSAWSTPREAVEAAHARGLEVLYEVYDAEGYARARDQDADLIGINNRDLRDDALPVDPSRAADVLREAGPARVPVLALSGVKSAADVKRSVRAGCQGVLVGTNLMRASDPAGRLRELSEGLR